MKARIHQMDVCQIYWKQHPCATNAVNDDLKEKDSDCESKRKIIEENLLLKRDNKELKDRLIILEKVLGQVLRDQTKKVETGK